MNVIVTGIPKKISSGVRTHTESLMAGLEELGVETHPIYSYQKGLKRVVTSYPVRTLGLINKNISLEWNMLTKTHFLKKDIKKYIDRNSVFNIQSVDCFNSIKPYMNSPKSSFVLTVHGPYADQLKAKGYNQDIINKISKLEIEAYRSIPGIVTVSNRMADYIFDISGRKDIHVIPNGVSISSKKIDKPKVKNDKKIKCVLAGGLQYYKGGHIAIEAISRAITSGMNISLDVIGEGPEYKNLQSLVTEKGIPQNVRFLGSIPNNEVRKRLLDYDISLVPSIPYGENGEEAFPYVCLESMGAGLVTIASKVGGLSTIIKDKSNGYLVPHSDPDAILNVLKRFSQAPIEFEYIRENAIETVMNNYSSEVMAQKYLDIYRNLLKEF